MDDERHIRRATFDSTAELYDAARPEYPAQLFADLIALSSLEPGDRLLEIGCGTGKASRPLLEAGFRVVCVELGEALARRARRNLAGFPFEVQVAPFEEWEAEHGAFDLVFAATGWHWLDPAVRYRRAHELLRPGGHLAFWSALHAFPAGFDPFFGEIQEVYEEIGERWEGDWPPPTPQQVPDDSEETERTGLFEDVQFRRYDCDRLYTADEYVALLETFSGHIAMEAAKRDHLFAEIRRRVGERDDPRVRRHWYAILHVARRAYG